MAGWLPIAWRVIDRPESTEGEGGPWGKGKGKGKGKGEDEGFFAKLFADDEKEEKPKADPWEGIPRRIVERVNLSIGYTDADWAEIEDGLTEGDLVVTGDGIRAEAEVKLPGDPNPKKPKDDVDDGGNKDDDDKDSESE